MVQSQNKKLMQAYDYLFKVILLGEASSGKSSISERLIEQTFANPYYYRMVQFGNYTFEIDNLRVRLQLWDTAGQERFRIMSPSYYRNAFGVVLVFDICQRRTFQQIDHWLAEANKHCPDDAVKILIGNKIDIKNKREVGEEEARIFAEERNMPYFEASAKEDQNIQNVFYLLAHELKKVRNGQKVSFVMFGSSPIQQKNSQNTCW